MAKNNPKLGAAAQPTLEPYEEVKIGLNKHIVCIGKNNTDPALVNEIILSLETIQSTGLNLVIDHPVSYIKYLVIGIIGHIELFNPADRLSILEDVIIALGLEVDMRKTL